MEKNMKPTIEILMKLKEDSKQNNDEVFTRLFRYILREDIYFIAYQNLFPNINNETYEKLNGKKIESTIKKLKNGNYKPYPAQKTYISKQNTSKKPLGIQTFTDKLIQEVLKMILESIYEPIFSKYSYSFRENKNYHLALGMVKSEFVNTKWFIEDGIKDTFDNINNETLLKLINRKIKDKRLLDLIRSFLKAGYMKNWRCNQKYSEAPQGEIISPILANIYLHELDVYIEKLKTQFNKKISSTHVSECKRAVKKMKRHNGLIEKNNKAAEETSIQWQMEKRKMLPTVLTKLQLHKEIKYVRCGGDFLIGITGNPEDLECIKGKLSSFMKNELEIELRKEEISVTHSSKKVRFFGYDVKVKYNNKGEKIKALKNTNQTLRSTVELTIPLDEKIIPLLFKKNIIIQTKNGKIKPCVRPQILSNTDLEIVSIYNYELYSICNYYRMACNYNKLSYLGYFMEYSCLHTLANKHKTSISKIYAKYRTGKGRWGIPYKTKNGNEIMFFQNIMKKRSLVLI